jgi:mono/diheme cytochrome c family protein
MSLRLLYLFLLAFVVQLVVAGCSVKVDERVVPGNTPKELTRGKYLVEGIAACGSCHGAFRKPGAPLSGGIPFTDRFGEVLAPNITPSRTYGLGRWSATDIKQLFRTGRSSSGEYVSHQAHEGFEWLSDADIVAISTYLAALRPVENEVEHRSISKLNPYNWVSGESGIDVKGAIPDINRANSVAYGHYLSRAVMRCNSCHNGVATFFGDPATLAGQRIVKRASVAKLVPPLAGILSPGRWSKATLKQYLRGGKGPDEKQRDQDFCPTAFYAQASDEDLNAVIEYIGQVEDAERD